MSDSDLIATATLSLCALVRDGLAPLPDAPEVRAASPWQGPEYGVSVHLFAVAPASHLSLDIPVPPGKAAATVVRLRYLLSFFGPQDVDIHRLAGRTMAMLAANPVVLGPSLADAARGAGLSGPTGGQMRLAEDPLDIAEMTSLWERFRPMRYTLSLGVACDIAG